VHLHRKKGGRKTQGTVPGKLEEGQTTVKIMQLFCWQDLAPIQNQIREKQH
jgi:hypothetical protein